MGTIGNTQLGTDTIPQSSALVPGNTNPVPIQGSTNTTTDNQNNTTTPVNMNLKQVGDVVVALGQALKAGSIPVVLPSDQIVPVSFGGSLPAGTNVIGHVIVDSIGNVSISSLPSLPAGTNVIGHIIVDSGSISLSTALPAGTNTIGGVKLVDTGGTNQLAIDSGGKIGVNALPALPSGTNVIGHVIIDSAGNVAITSLPSLPAGTNVIGHVVVDSGSVSVNTISNFAVETGGNLALAKADLDTLAGIVSANKAAVKAAANDIADLATLAGIVSSAKAAIKSATNDIVDLATLLARHTDTFGNNTAISAATTFTAIPLVSAIAASSSANLTNNGYQDTFIVQINVTSAFVGTIGFYGLLPDGATLQQINAHQRGTASNGNNTAINTGSAVEQTWEGSIACFKAIYVVCTAFTSGAASVQIGLTAANYAHAIINTVASNLTQLNGATPQLDGASSNRLGMSLYGKSSGGAAGDTAFLLDSSGRPIIGNIVQIGGQVPKLDNTNELGVSIYGKNSAAGDTAFLLDSSGRLISIGSIEDAIRNGKGFQATSGNLKTATNTNLSTCPLSVFNPSASGKSILIYSIRVGTSSATSGSNSLNMTTTDPSGTTGFTNIITPANAKPGAGSSVASCCSSPNSISASITATGTVVDAFSLGGNAELEVLTNGATILLPSGSANGIELVIFVSTAGNAFLATVRWLEF